MCVCVCVCSACTSASLEPSYVLRAIGADEDLAHSSIRYFRRISKHVFIELLSDTTQGLWFLFKGLSSFWNGSHPSNPKFVNHVVKPFLNLYLAGLVLAGSPQKKRWTTQQKDASTMCPDWGRWGQLIAILNSVLGKLARLSLLFLSVHQSSVGDGSRRHRPEEHQVGTTLEFPFFISWKSCESVNSVNTPAYFLSINTHKLPVWLELWNFRLCRSSQMKKAILILLLYSSCCKLNKLGSGKCISPLSQFYLLL